MFQSLLEPKAEGTCKSPSKMLPKLDLARVGVFTSELQMDQYMKVNERRDHLSGLIGGIIHSLLLNYCKKYGEHNDQMLQFKIIERLSRL